MLFCEQCRLEHQLKMPATYPYHDHGMTKCEMCRRHKDCYDYPALFIQDKTKFTLEQKTLYKRLQDEYHQLADELIVSFGRGGQAGRPDHQNTDQLRVILIKNGEEVDWYATYKLRQKIQEGYRKFETRRK